MYLACTHGTFVVCFSESGDYSTAKVDTWGPREELQIHLPSELGGSGVGVEH